MSEDAKKTLMQVSTWKVGGVEVRPILTVELDGSITYGEPLTQAETKALLDYVIEKGAYNTAVGQAITSMIFSSELARLSRLASKHAPGVEGNTGTATRPPGHVYVCFNCGTTADPHVCPGPGRRPAP